MNTPLGIHVSFVSSAFAYFFAQLSRRRLIPNKPIRYVVNTHAHADHTGGLPAMVAEGATIITQKNNETFFTRALNTPRTLLNDQLATNPNKVKKVKIEAVSKKKVYSDGTRRVELYHIYPAPHSNGLIVAYFPREKVLFQGDFSLPAAGQPANDHVKALVGGARDAQSGFRALYQRARARDSADEGGALESPSGNSADERAADHSGGGAGATDVRELRRTSS